MCSWRMGVPCVNACRDILGSCAIFGFRKTDVDKDFALIEESVNMEKIYFANAKTFGEELNARKVKREV